MSDFCAKNFNWKGQNGKRAFSQSAIKEVVISLSHFIITFQLCSNFLLYRAFDLQNRAEV